MRKLLNFLSVVFGWYIWRRTGNILIGAVAAVILFPLIGPVIEGLIRLAAMLIKEFILLFVPAQEVRLVQPRGAGTDGRGLRVFLGMKDFSDRQPNIALPRSDPEAVAAAAGRALSENSSFTYLDTYVTEHDLPEEIYAVRYKRGLHFDKAIKAWRAATDIKHFKQQKSNINIFSCDLKADDGKTEYARAIFLFDSAIEIPKDAEMAPAAQENPPQEIRE